MCKLEEDRSYSSITELEREFFDDSQLLLTLGLYYELIFFKSSYNNNILAASRVESLKKEKKYCLPITLLDRFVVVMLSHCERLEACYIYMHLVQSLNSTLLKHFY